MVKDHLGVLYNSQKEMCAAYGINHSTYQSRIRKGWTQENALTEKVNERGISLRQFCIENGLDIILLQFDDKENYPETVDTITAKSDKVMRFTYDCKHSAFQRVADKTSKRSIFCPICQNRGGIGKSIQSEFPDTFALMFNEKKNHIKASEVPYHSGVTYIWNCLRCGEEFKGKPCDVTSGKRVCRCANEKMTDAEKMLAYYFKQLDADMEINYKVEGWKYDFYLKRYNLLVEYDGYPWHDWEKAKKNDVIKDRIAIGNGYKICRLRDSKLTDNRDLKATIWEFDFDYSYRYLKQLPFFLSSMIGSDSQKMDIDISRDFGDIYANYIRIGKNKSLLSENPAIAEYIDKDDERNGNPEFVFTRSRKIYFFLRHPVYRKLKWSDTAHDLFARKNIMPQAINMCAKIIEMFPDMEEQVSAIGLDMRADTVLYRKCDRCNEIVQYSYVQLYYSKGNQKLCQRCLKQYRMNNLLNSKDNQ